jgi:hypothetical protein
MWSLWCTPSTRSYSLVSPLPFPRHRDLTIEERNREAEPSPFLPVLRPSMLQASRWTPRPVPEADAGDPCILNLDFTPTARQFGSLILNYRPGFDLLPPSSGSLPLTSGEATFI